ncbi:MAG: hypothetical protein KDH15_21540 [Rhodocyclaceae bacterium]|nr:hypothetical protein [Rhodocyclaceae bacterium]
MKADRYGTPTEQARSSMGWLTATQRRETGVERRCASCAHFSLNPYTNGEGGRGVAVLCIHPMAGGHRGMATRENALCGKWEVKP